jgi:hypothetical protein
MKKFLTLILFISLGFQSWAQSTSCAQTLRLATSTYEQGRLHELEGILANCLANGFTKEEKVIAYKLLTQANIYLEEPQKADDTMLKLLQTDHYFEINKDVDPAEFVALYNTFRTSEIYRVGAKLGVNATQPNVVNTITAVEIADDSEYKYGIAILFGGVVDVPLNDKMTLHGELLYLQRKFEIDLKVDRGFTVEENPKPLSNQFEGIETENWISLPLSFEYKIADKKYNPYVAGGVSVDYLLNAELKGERIRSGVNSIQETSFDFNPLREKINISALVAAGVKTKMGGGYFIAEVRYLHGITNVSSAETAYENQQATWEQGFADSVFKLSSLSVSGSYVINIFNPRKKTIKTSK